MATIANVPPQDICEWAIDGQVQSVPAMRAEWLPQTTTGYEIDPPAIAGIKRSLARRLAEDDERWPRVNEILAELAAILK